MAFRPRLRPSASLSLIALLLGGCAGGGGSGGGSGGGGGSSFGSGGLSEPNVYADAGDRKPTRLERLTVFGDSYSSRNDSARPGVVPWDNRLAGEVGAGTAIFARTGASASDNGAFGTFKDQVDRYLDGSARPTGHDLTAVFLGINDAQTRAIRISDALSDYRRQVGRILDNGVTADGQKLFVTLIPDVSKTPDIRGSDDESSVRSKVNDFNHGVVDIANSNGGIIAVDVKSVTDRVLSDPGRYGFTNVTTPDRGRSNSTALFFDTFHYGNHGQEIIKQVFESYLTRGRSYANTLSAGAEMRAKMRDAISSSLDAHLGAAAFDQKLGLSSFVVGDRAGSEEAFSQDREVGGDPTRASFERNQLVEAQDGGFGINYSLDADTRIGVVMTNYGDSQSMHTDLQSASDDANGQAVAVYYDDAVGPLRLHSLVSWSMDQYRKVAHDGLVGMNDSASFGGQTLAVSETASLPVRFASGSFSPWVGVDYSRQAIDGFDQGNPYVSDVHFAGTQVEDTIARMGLRGELDPIGVGRLGMLALSGGITYSYGLAQGDLKATMEETGTGYVQHADIPRERTNALGLDLAASLATSEQLALNADYGVAQQFDGATSQSVLLRVKYSFW